MNRTAINISLCMIVRDEAKHLDRCLASVGELVQEIIIVDTGSIDRTKAIAKKYTDKIYDFHWAQDFAAARNFSLKQATGDWILVLDADEFLDSQTAAKLTELVATEKAPDAYLLPIHNLMVAETDDWQNTLVLRLFRNCPDLRFSGKIHEQIIVPTHKTVRLAEEGPIIIHLGYLTNNRPVKNQRNFAMLQKVLALEPDNPYYHYYISIEYFSQRNLPKAIEHAYLALEGIPNDVVIFKLSAIRNTFTYLFYNHQLEQAESLLNSYLELFPDIPDFYYYLANLKQKQGRYQEAIANYTKAIGINNPSILGCSIKGSNSFKALAHRGLCYEQQGLYFAAIKDYKRALDMNPNYNLPLASLIKCLLYVGGEKFCLAFVNKNFVLESTELKVLLARSLFADGHPEAAKKLLIELTSETEASLLLGEIALAQKQPIQALKYFRQIRPTSSAYGNALVFQCLCLWQQKKSLGVALTNKLSTSTQGKLVAQLLRFIDHGKPLNIQGLSLEQSKALSELALQLIVKLLESVLVKQANILKRWLLKVKPEFEGKVLRYYHMLGYFNEQLKPADGLQASQLYTDLANEYLARLPKLSLPK